MTWWNRKSKPNDEAESIYLGEVKPGQFIPCEDGDEFRKVQTGFEWFEWSHGGKGVPWRVNTEEFNQMLIDGWQVVGVFDSFTLLNRPTFVYFLDKPGIRGKK